ncbi:MAG: peptidoglycan-binding protein [Cocleimonas sp.]|nr:peptidoglycan-binding protein [Cocleimonas sp.]
MKNAHQLSIAVLVMAGFITTGCSQQQIAGGPDQTQIAGGGSQQMASQSQIQKAPVTPAPKIIYKDRVVIKYQTKYKTKTVCNAKCGKRPARNYGHTHPAVPGCTKTIRHHHKFGNPRHHHSYSCKKKAIKHVKPRPRWGHGHPAIPGCTKSVRHNHKFKRGGIHRHSYSCRKPAKKKYYPRYNKWTHAHPNIPRCTKSIKHTHKFNNRNHAHDYGCRRPVVRPRPIVRPPAPRPIVRPVQKPPVDVYALQRKLKAKGYYKGPIDGIVGSGTRGALQRFMQNR